MIENVKSSVMIEKNCIKIRNKIISRIKIIDGSGIGSEIKNFSLSSRTLSPAKISTIPVMRTHSHHPQVDTPHNHHQQVDTHQSTSPIGGYTTIHHTKVDKQQSTTISLPNSQ